MTDELNDLARRAAHQQWQQLSQTDRECVRAGELSLADFEASAAVYEAEFARPPSPEFSRLFARRLLELAHLVLCESCGELSVDSSVPSADYCYGCGYVVCLECAARETDNRTDKGIDGPHTHSRITNPHSKE